MSPLGGDLNYNEKSAAPPADSVDERHHNGQINGQVRKYLGERSRLSGRDVELSDDTFHHDRDEKCPDEGDRHPF